MFPVTRRLRPVENLHGSGKIPVARPTRSRRDSRTVVPGPTQPEENPTIQRQLEGVLSDRRTQHVSAEVLEPLSVPRRHGDSRVEVEASEVSLALGDRGAQRRLRPAADAQDHFPCTTARRDPAADRGARDPREQRRLARQRIDSLLPLRLLQVDAAALDQARDPPRDGEQEGLHFILARLRIRHEAEASVTVVDEHALHCQGVEVDVQIERRAEALDRGHRAAAPTPDAATSGSEPLEAEQGADEDGEHRAAELVVPRESTTARRDS